MLINKNEIACHLVDLDVPEGKENETIDKYLDFIRELKKAKNNGTLG